MWISGQFPPQKFPRLSVLANLGYVNFKLLFSSSFFLVFSGRYVNSNLCSNSCLKFKSSKFNLNKEKSIWTKNATRAPQGILKHCQPAMQFGSLYNFFCFSWTKVKQTMNFLTKIYFSYFISPCRAPSKYRRPRTDIFICGRNPFDEEHSELSSARL